MSELPLVSIVTPCLNAADYLEQAIQSVLAQDYPHIEYIVMDGGSTDDTVAILRKYEGKLTWVSEPDRGQSDAINRGFLRSRGRIFAFLCADDAYLPGAVSTAVRHLLANPDYGGVYGQAWLVDEQGNRLRPYPTRPFDARRLQWECFICQPAVFLWREIFAEAGMLDAQLHYGLDYDLWIRISQKHRLLQLDAFLALCRMHARTKTLRSRREVYRENIRIVRRHFGYVPFRHIYGYACSLLDSRDGFFEPVRPSLAKYALSFLLGCTVNRGQVLSFCREAVAEARGALQRRAWPQPPWRQSKTRAGAQPREAPMRGAGKRL
ncbi:MAG: glycosyltransferase family 2 protein [Bryobacterales bacterium]|nr:glycosyltransferase [Bryobacteraceae bacterium]MDW8353048.1 glycosyltransferase family 2 protein [Bryobacterales bacterium]